MDKHGRIVVGYDFDGTLSDSVVRFRENNFAPKEQQRHGQQSVEVMMLLSFATADLIGIGRNVRDGIESSSISKDFKEVIGELAKEGVRAVCVTANNHKKQINALLAREGVKDLEGELEVIHSRRKRNLSEYGVDILVDDSIIGALRRGGKSKRYIMWAGYRHNAPFGGLLRHGFANVASTKDELLSTLRNSIGAIKHVSEKEGRHGRGTVVVAATG